MLGVISHFDKRKSSVASGEKSKAEASTGNTNANTSNNNNTPTGSPPSKGLSLLVLDVHRLLHCMEKEEDTDELPPNISWRSLEQRLDLLQSLWQQVQHAFHEQRQGEAAFDRPPRWYQDYEQRVYRATQKAHEAIHSLQRQEEEEHLYNDVDPPTKKPTTNLIDEIFFSEEKKEQESEGEEEAEYDEPEAPVEHDLIGQPMPSKSDNPLDIIIEEEEEETPHRKAASSNNTNNNNNMDVEAFQQAQREQIEEAIAQMARQMKEETARIHTTLKGQTQNLLGEMEDIATENVAEVTKVTEDVSAHVNDGWKRTFGTWTLLILVASTFLFSLVTIYMIPKYNSPASAAPPSSICRMVNGKQECIDVNAWLTGQGEKEEEKDVREDDYLDDYDRHSEECELDMYGRCVTDESMLEDEEAEQLKELLRQQKEQEQLEAEAAQTRQMEQQKADAERERRLEAERLEQQRLEAERLEQERLLALEAQRVEQEKLQALENEKLEQERLAQEKAILEAQQRAEAEASAAAAATLAAQEQAAMDAAAEADRLEQERLEAEGLEDQEGHNEEGDEDDDEEDGSDLGEDYDEEEDEDDLESKRLQAQEWRNQQTSSDDEDLNEEMSEEERLIDEELRLLEQEGEDQFQQPSDDFGEGELTQEEKEKLLQERADRERLHAMRKQEQGGGGDTDMDAMLAERQRMKEERDAQMKLIDERRETELQQLGKQRRQQEERMRFVQEQREKLQQAQKPESNAQQDEADAQDEPKELSEEERTKREFWERQKAKDEEAKKRKEAIRLQQEEQARKEAREREEALLEQERIREHKRLELERKIQAQEEERQQQAQAQANADARGFGSFTSDDSAFVEPKGFESFGADAAYRPRGFQDQQKMKGGLNADIPRGFGSFGKEDSLPKGVAGGKADPFGSQASSGGGGGTGGAEAMAPFLGRPFTPRDIRKAASTNDVEMLTDYLDQRSMWVDKKDKNDWSALHFAARAGHAEAVELLLRANADVNLRTKAGETALDILIKGGGEHHPVAAMLRNHDA